jgi:prevent-host-death family protein
MMAPVWRGEGLGRKGKLGLAPGEMNRKVYTYVGPEDPVNTMTITSARQGFLELSDAVQDEPIMVTKHGHPVMALLSVQQFEGMVETIEILSDQVFSKRLQKSLEQARQGRAVGLAEAASRLGL